MLAAAANAFVAALRGHRAIKDVVRAVDRLPKLELEELLKRYAADAPAFYVLPGTLRVVEGDCFVITQSIGAVVRNVAGPDQAFQGDGIDIGVDQLLLLATRALHAHTLAGCSWNLVRAEMEDDPLFDAAGVAAMSITFESTPIEIDADWQLGELDDFKHFHTDYDLPAHAGATEYDSWLAEPPNYATSRPDLQDDLTLQGAS